ncbi:MAG TPA: lmo0937 family membrane protein [Candidatus Acidoferrum sp.]|nr:lmo0937 family membrane protein [Candidatus Acidoferrum sp.]
MRFGPFLAVALLLFILWIGGFLFFHVAGFLIHLLLVFAVVSLVIHLLTGAKTA